MVQIYPPVCTDTEPIITMPCTLLDCHGRILMVYLPEVLDERCQVRGYKPHIPTSDRFIGTDI